jgi:hypothetical protein
MVKRWRWVAGALLLGCLVPSMVLAANESMVTLTLGRQVPTGVFNDVSKGGSSASLSCGYRVAHWLALGADAAYFRSLGEYDGANLTVWEPSINKNVDITLAENWTITEFGVYARAYCYQRGRISAYFRGGTGAYTLHWSEDVKAASGASTVKGDEEQGKFGIHGGGGFNIRINGGNTIGLESLVHCIFTRDAKVSMWMTGATIGFGPVAK